MTSPVSPSETIAKAMEDVTAEEWIVNGDRFSVETNATYIPDQKVIALCATGEGAMARSLYIAACNPVAMREVLDELYALRESALKLEAMQRGMAELRALLSRAEEYIIDGVTNAKADAEMNAAYPSRAIRYNAALEEVRQLHADVSRTLIQGEKK